MTIWSTGFAFLLALAVSALATPIVARLATTVGAIDHPDERKVNRRPNIPLLGGISVALGFFVGLAAAMLLAPKEVGFRSHLEGLLLGGLVVLSLGALDDRWGLSALPKLLVQILAAGIAIAFGFQIDFAFRSPDDDRLLTAKVRTGSGVILVGPGMKPLGTRATPELCERGPRRA